MKSFQVPKLVSKPSETTPSGDFAKPAQGPKAEVKIAARTEAVSHSASSDLLGLGEMPLLCSLEFLSVILPE